MSKKIEYGKTFGIWYEAYRVFLKKRYVPELDIPARDQFVYSFVSERPETLSPYDVLAMNFFIMDMDHKFVHIYLPDQTLIDFLTTTKIKDLQFFKEFVLAKSNEMNSDEKESTATLSYCLHPAKVKQGYVFHYEYSDSQNIFKLVVMKGDDVFVISGDDLNNKKSEFYTNPKMNEMGTIALNLLGYISTFPECLTEGVPHGIKTENNHYLNVTDKVKDILEDSKKGIVIPHYRRGYFRLLSSDYFVNKRGKTVFVHETMVNGKAKTLEPAV